MLDVAVDLEIDYGTGRGRLVGEGQEVILEVDDPAALAGVIDRRSLVTLSETLAQAGITLRVRSNGRPVLSAGRDIETGFLSSLLGMSGVELSTSFALRTALGRIAARP